MKNSIFRTTASSIIARVIREVEKFKDDNSMHLYQLLYSRANQRIIRDSGRIGEPYYSFSKRTSTETMSRIINGKGKITDEVAILISENMGVPCSKLIWGVHELGMTQLDFLFYNLFWINVFTDAIHSSKYKYKIIELFKDYIPFSKFIVKNKIRFITNQSQLDELFGTEEFNQIILADISLRHQKLSVWKLYMQYFLSKENSLKNLSKTIEEFFDYCHEEYFQFVVDDYGNSYGLVAYQLLDDCVEMTLTEYEMEHFNNWNEISLLKERIAENDEEWVLKKELVIATYNFVDTLASYQRKIEDITLKSEWRFSFEQE